MHIRHIEEIYQGWLNNLENVRFTSSLQQLELRIQRTARHYQRLLENWQTSNLDAQNEAVNLIQEVETILIILENLKILGNDKGPDKTKFKWEVENRRKQVRKYQQNLENLSKRYDVLTRLRRELQEKFEIVQQRVEEMRSRLPQFEYDMDQQQGLQPARVQKFHQFSADESIIGDRCTICQDDDIEVGRRMMRLDCDGQHIFCQGCVEGWFADHNTCPNCRYTFQ